MKEFKYLSVLLLVVFSMFSCQEDSINPETEILENVETSQSKFDKRCCHTNEHTEKLMQDPAYRAAQKEKISKVRAYEATRIAQRALCSNPPLLPVAVHYQGVPNPNTACLIGLAQSQINILNDDFQGANSDITNWTGNAASSFPGVSNAETCLAFQLADQDHPTGYGLTNGDLAITINQTTGDFNGDWSGYINIFVQFDTGVLGYSPLGGNGDGDGVVIDASGFSTGNGCGSVAPEAPFDLGRTLTHEVGHFLLLDHIWGGGCGQDDDVSDTPNSSSDYGGCPSIGESSCNSVDMHMNYMDYTNDACMYMFSVGQGNRMEAYVASSLGNVVSNGSTVISGNTGGGGGGGNPLPCATATNLSTNVTGTTTADFTFTGSSTATLFRVRYKTVVGGTYVTINTTATNVSLTNLAAGTDYQIQVRTQCPTGWTAWTAFDFFTTQANNGGGNNGQTPGCSRPADLDSDVISDTQVEISWTDYADAIVYRVRYKKVSGGVWTTFNTNDPSAILTSLQTDTEYKFRVRAKCPSGWTAYSVFGYFTTQSSGNNGGGNGGGNGACLDLEIQITTDDYGNESAWYITDDNGSTVAQGGPYNNGYAGDVFTQGVCLSDGCYTLTLTDTYGDGMCCDYGDGGLAILNSDGTVALAEDGVFGYTKDIDFCVTSTLVNPDGGTADRKNAARNASEKYERMIIGFEDDVVSK